MPSELISQLRAEIDPLKGPARLPGLLRLAQALATEYTTTGPGAPAGKPCLDEGITRLAEAYGYVQAGDPLRVHIALTLGHHLSIRYLTHGGAGDDCDRAIALLQTAVGSAGPQGLEPTLGRVLLGQLLLSRAAAYIQTQQPGIAARGGGYPPTRATEDAGRAETYLRAVVDGEPVSDELMTVARMMLEMTAAIRALLRAMSGDIRDMDLSRLTGMAATMQQVQERMRQGGGLGYRLPQNGFFDISLSQLAAADPTEWPVPVVLGEEPAVEAAVVTAPLAIAAEPPDADPDSLRGQLSALLPAGDDSAGEVWQMAADLLLPGAPAPDVAAVDKMVALASTLAELPGADPTQAAIDAYVLAVTLLLRDRVDGHSTGADRRAGAKALLTAAQRIPLSHPAGVVILRSLGAFLSGSRPLDSIEAAVADGYADRLDTAVAAGVTDLGDLATLRALGGICRAATALAQVRDAAGDIPLAYPWPAPITAASQLTSG
ncbi:MAG TPA: hypothetical protein VFC00_15810 [Micromonosporaceae bacterium]|nr:hypothetical protein [Micromonosporaceae bacterium]